MGTGEKHIQKMSAYTEVFEFLIVVGSVRGEILAFHSFIYRTKEGDGPSNEYTSFFFSVI